MMIRILLLVVWLSGTAACFVVIRPQLENDYEPVFATVIGSAMFWPLMLPVFCCTLAYRAANSSFQAFKARKNRPALRSGFENGLYE